MAILQRTVVVVGGECVERCVYKRVEGIEVSWPHLRCHCPLFYAKGAHWATREKGKGLPGAEGWWRQLYVGRCHVVRLCKHHGRENPERSRQGAYQPPDCASGRAVEVRQCH